MSCNCRIGGGIDGVCAFHRAEALRVKQDLVKRKKQEWIIAQINKIAVKLGIELDPMP